MRYFDSAPFDIGFWENVLVSSNNGDIGSFSRFPMPYFMLIVLIKLYPFVISMKGATS